jgi:hypothetical protein
VTNVDLSGVAYAAGGLPLWSLLLHMRLLGDNCQQKPKDKLVYISLLTPRRHICLLDGVFNDNSATAAGVCWGQ